MKLSSSFDPDADAVLHSGDCIDLFSQVPDGLAKLIVTSPPYNVGKEYESRRLHLDDYLDQQRVIITECARVLHPQGSICWQVGNYVELGRIIPLDVKLHPIFEGLGLI